MIHNMGTSEYTNPNNKQDNESTCHPKYSRTNRNIKTSYRKYLKERK